LKPISHLPLSELFGDSLTSSLCVNIEKGTETWVATGMLVQQLEAFTDSVVVRENDKPVGIVGGKDIIVKLAKDPSSNLFYNTKVEDIMEEKFPIVSSNSTLEEVIQFWQQTRRAVAAIPNEFSDYSIISAKKFLHVGKRCKTDLTVSEIPEKPLLTFSQDQTIGDVLQDMLENNIRRLMLKDSKKFINDRIILQKITDELKCLKDVANFLAMPVTDFGLEDAVSASKDMTIPELSKTMLEMEHPCIIVEDRIITPWDVCLVLLSEKITEIQP